MPWGSCCFIGLYIWTTHDRLKKCSCCDHSSDKVLLSLYFFFCLSQIMAGFGQVGFPHCNGAADSTHILISAPKAQAAEYVNRKSTFSVLLQCTTDYTGRFRDVEVGCSGINLDVYVFKQSALCTNMDAGGLTSHPIEVHVPLSLPHPQLLLMLPTPCANVSLNLMMAMGKGRKYI